MAPRVIKQPKTPKADSAPATPTDAALAPHQKVTLPPAVTRARLVTVRPKAPVKEPPDLVLVRAVERGQYGLDIDIIIRNPGEVFEMATSAMRVFPLAKGEHPIEDAVIIETDKGQFELPGWVELVEAGEAVPAEAMQSQGHKTSHGVHDGSVL